MPKPVLQSLGRPRFDTFVIDTGISGDRFFLVDRRMSIDRFDPEEIIDDKKIENAFRRTP
jgi:hypothetical protein